MPLDRGLRVITEQTMLDIHNSTFLSITSIFFFTMKVHIIDNLENEEEPKEQK